MFAPKGPVCTRVAEQCGSSNRFWGANFTPTCVETCGVPNLRIGAFQASFLGAEVNLQVGQNLRIRAFQAGRRTFFGATCTPTGGRIPGIPFLGQIEHPDGPNLRICAFQVGGATHTHRLAALTLMAETQGINLHTVTWPSSRPRSRPRNRPLVAA